MTPDTAVSVDDLAADQDGDHDVNDDVTALVDDLTDAIAADPDRFAFDRGTVREDLTELLLACLLARTGGANGTELRNDVIESFGIEFSPGTTYPRLHALRDDGVLDEVELARTIQYSVADHGRVRDDLASAMYQHAVLAAFYREALRR